MFEHFPKRLVKSAKPIVPFAIRNYLRGLQKKRRVAKLRTEAYDIVYVQTVVGLCGGVRVILEHVSRLRARGHRVAVWCVCGDASWFPREVPVVPFESVDKLRAALTRFRGVKVACWHETAPMVAESLQPGDRGYYLVQDIEEWYSETPEQITAARKSYQLGLRPISEGLWVERQLRERFGLNPIQVHIGLDLETFQPRGGERRPDQIMTQARTWSGGVGAGSRIKGWDVARKVIERCRELNPDTSLLTFSLEDKPRFDDSLSHQHFKYPSDDELAQKYSTSGLYLLTSRHEGFGLTAAEAMACGCPVVATRADGNEEFCIDGVTALTADPEDVERIVRHCRCLQTEPEFASELAASGRRFIMQYTWDRVIDRLEAEFTRVDRSTELPKAEVRVEDLKVPISALEYPDLDLPPGADCDWTVVIPTVGSVDRVVECVSSCRKFACDRRIQFVVVDDGCPDPLVREVLREAAGDLKFELRFNHQNLGFSAAVNRGLRGARGQFALICNNDIQFDRPWADVAESAFSDPKVGVIGARLLSPDGQTIQHAGTEKVPGQLLYIHSYLNFPAAHVPARRDRYVWYATGALMAVRRSTLRELGGLSTGYGLAYEDLDYCLRAWLLGVRVKYCGAFAARHQLGATRGASVAAKRSRPLVWLQREDAGRAYFLRKWDAFQHLEELTPFLKETNPVAENNLATSLRESITLPRLPKTGSDLQLR